MCCCQEAETTPSAGVTKFRAQSPREVCATNAKSTGRNWPQHARWCFPVSGSVAPKTAVGRSLRRVLSALPRPRPLPGTQLCIASPSHLKLWAASLCQSHRDSTQRLLSWGTFPGISSLASCCMAAFSPPWTQLSSFAVLVEKSKLHSLAKLFSLPPCHVPGTSCSIEVWKVCEWVSDEWLTQWMNESVNAWKSGWMNEWVCKWMNIWMSGWVNEWVSKRTNDEWLTQWMNEWVGKWMKEWVNEWIDEWVNEWVGEWMSRWMNE